MVNEAGYTGDAIFAKTVIFPKHRDERSLYAQAVSRAAVKRDKMPLSWLQQFTDTVENQVGQKRLSKIERRFSHFSTRFYVWAQSNPKWALAVKIASLGLGILLERNGKANYDKSHELLPIVEAIDTLKDAIDARKAQIRNIEQTITHATWGDQLRPETWVDNLETLVWNGINKEFYHSLRNRLKNRNTDLSTPAVYTVEARYEAMCKIYERLKCDQKLEQLKSAKQVYDESKKWKNLLPALKMSLLQKMLQNPERFEPLFEDRCQEALKLLSPTDFYSLSDDDRQTTLELATYLMNGHQKAPRIKRAYDDLKKHVESHALKKCSWADDDTKRLQSICKDLKLSDEFDNAYLLYRLSGPGMYKLSQEDRKAVIDQACFLMGDEDEDLADSIEDAFSNLRDYVQDKALKECLWTPKEAEYLQGLCEDLGMVPEFVRAFNTSRIEQTWQNVGYAERIENTKDILLDPKHYELELERRRKEVFALSASQDKLTFEQWEYLITMLRLLLPIYEQGCRIELRRQKERLLSSMADKASRENQELLGEFVKKAQIIRLDPKIMQDLSSGGSINALWLYLQSGKRYDDRLEASIHESLRDERMQLRRIGCATEVVRVPTQEDLKLLTFVENHIAITVPQVPVFKGKADLMQLMKYLKEADKLKLIPDVLLRPKDDGTNQPMKKKQVLDALEGWLKKPIANDENYELNARTKGILMHYVVSLQQRFMACKTKEEKRELYVEVVELVGKEMGFAYYACNDRKFNAAMMIYSEKIAGLSLESESTEKKVQFWAAKKRSDFVTAMLHDMIHEAMESTGTNLDVASAIGYWRYDFKDEFGLGDVPPSQYNVRGGLLRAEIRKRFENTYTPDWLLAEAMSEHRKQDGLAVMKIAAINDFLASRLTNYQVLSYDLLDEDTYELLDRGMALYLQEAGVFEPVV